MLDASQKAVESCRDSHEMEMKSMMDDISQSSHQKDIHTPNGLMSYPQSALKVFEERLRAALMLEKEAALKEFKQSCDSIRQKAVTAAVERVTQSYEDKLTLFRDDLYNARNELNEAHTQLHKLSLVQESNTTLQATVDQLTNEIASHTQTNNELTAEIIARGEDSKQVLKESLASLTVVMRKARERAVEAARQESKDTIEEAKKGQTVAEEDRAWHKAKYSKERKARIKLHNELIDLQGNIRVLCRVRPLSDRERGMEDGLRQEVTECVDDKNLLVAYERNGKSRSQRFEFDRVFDTSASQEEVFEAVQPLCISFLDGYNICIFAYGQTGSGKTFTMEGEGTGVSPRCIVELFDLQEERQEEFRYELVLSMMQIHNDAIFDLLGNLDTKLNVRQTDSSNGKFEVIDATEVLLCTADQALGLIRCGQKNRAAASHNLNQDSSRSHAIITIKMTGVNLIDDRPCTPAKLHLVDLAGSERMNKTMAVGDALVEANNINKSLLALGDVIHAVASKHSHIPYRNSKLTFLLQDSLGGLSKVFTFVNISPAAYNCSETVFSLKFAARCRLTDIGSNRPSPSSAGPTALSGSSLNLSDSTHGLGDKEAPKTVNRQYLPPSPGKSPGTSVSSRDSRSSQKPPVRRGTVGSGLMCPDFPSFSVNPTPAGSRVSSRKASPNSLDSSEASSNCPVTSCVNMREGVALSEEFSVSVV
jgi:kinesin family protein C2/C3